jgi:hypothetical protein
LPYLWNTRRLWGEGQRHVDLHQALVPDRLGEGSGGGEQQVDRDQGACVRHLRFSGLFGPVIPADRWHFAANPVSTQWTAAGLSLSDFCTGKSLNGEVLPRRLYWFL